MRCGGASGGDRGTIVRLAVPPRAGRLGGRDPRAPRQLPTQPTPEGATLTPTTPTTVELLHLPATSGDTYWGPGDAYRFLVTGAQTVGAYFAMEAIVPPGGGPPPHIHRNEDETFHVLEGECDFNLDGELVTAGPGDFVNIPRGRVHNFHNAGTTTTRLILTFTPAN